MTHANDNIAIEALAPQSDLAVIDADGFLFHCGRADGAIMRGGFKVLPDTVERALLLHPAVAAAAVVGMADARLGQVPAVAIQTKLDVPRPSASELEQHLRAHSAVRELFQPAHVSRT